MVALAMASLAASIDPWQDLEPPLTRHKVREIWTKLITKTLEVNHHSSNDFHLYFTKKTMLDT